MRFLNFYGSRLGLFYFFLDRGFFRLNFLCWERIF